MLRERSDGAVNINAVVDYAVDAGVAVITVDSPPVNALSAPVRAGIYRGVETAAADAAVGAIVLIPWRQAWAPARPPNWPVWGG